MKNILSSLSKLLFLKVPLPSVVVLLIIAGSAYITYSVMVKYPETFGLLKGPSIIKKEEKALVAEISKSLTLPKDEEPTIATVSEPEKLSDQSFFKNAKTGDRVLIYQKSKKVILYRPSERTVIEVGVVNIREEGGEIKAVENYKFAILDSTKDLNVLASMESRLKEVVSSSEIISKELSQLPYAESLIVDAKGDKAELTERLAQDLEVKVGSLPLGETSVEGVDFILLIGSDKLGTDKLP